MTEFFDTIDMWERELLEKTSSTEKVVDDVEPQMIVEDNKESSESFEAIDPSDDGLFQMLSASVVPTMSPKKRSSLYPPHIKANSPQRRSMRSRPAPSSSESPGFPLDGEGVLSTPKTEARKGKPTSSSRSASRSHGGQEQSEKDDLRSSQKSSSRHEQSEDLRSSRNSSGRNEQAEKDGLRSSQKSSSRHEQSDILRSSRNSSSRNERAEKDGMRSSQKSSSRHEQPDDLRSPRKSSGRREQSDDLRSSRNSSGRHEQAEKDGLRSSQKSSSRHEPSEKRSSEKSSGSIARNPRSTPTSTNGGRSKSQPRGGATRHHPTHRKESNRAAEGERQRSLSLGRKGHRLSDHGQTQQSRYHKSPSTASSLSRTAHDSATPQLEGNTGMQVEPPTTPDPSSNTDDHSLIDDIEDGKEESSTQGGGKGVVAMLSQGITSAARTTRKEAEKVVKGAAKAVTHPKELARSVGEAATAMTTGVMNATKTTNTESSSEENQQEDLGNQNKDLNRLDSESKSESTHRRSRNETMYSPKGADKRHRERSRTASGEMMSPQKSTNPDGLTTRSEHLDKDESGSGSRPIGRMTIRERRHQAAQQRNANRPESQQQPKTSTETRSRAITSPNVPPRKTMDRKQSSQSQSSESKISDSSRKNQNSDLPNENDDDWLKARLTRQDDIMMFAKKKDLSEQKPVSWNGREQETMGELSRSPRTSTGEIKLETTHERNQDQEKKNILTAGAKVAKVAIGVTALGAREAINAITNPKREIEKVVRVSNKAAKKTARAASNPKETVQKVASITQKISLNVVREATEVTKGTLQLGRDTVQGTVGYVSGLLYDDDEGKDGAHLKEKEEYDSQKLQSRQINASLVDRINRVVETSDEKGNNNSPMPPQSPGPRRGRGKNKARPGMPDKMPSRMVVNTTGKSNNLWET